MAKVTIAGKAVVITSAVKYEDLVLVKKYRPNSLILKGGEDGKEPVFAISVGSSNLSKVSATFGEQTADGYACMTLISSEKPEDVKQYVIDELGGTLMLLNKLEETIPAVLDEIAAEKAEVESNISVL